MKPQTFSSRLLALASITFLTACGGGGGGATQSDVSVAFTSFSVDDGSAPKNIAFSWAVDDAINVDEFVLLENADGSSGFTEVARADGSATSLEYELSVHLTDWINAEYMLEARSSSDAQIGSSNEVNLTQALSAEATGYLKASSTSENEYFGFAVAVSGDGATMAVGAPGDASEIAKGDAADLDNAGAVYVFKNQLGIWVQTLKVTPNTRIEGDEFGKSIALSEDGLTLAVGAPYANDQVPGIGTGNSTNTGADDAGAVYVYTLAGNGRSRSSQIYIKASNPTSNDNFGYSVSLTQDGNWLAVGSPWEDSRAVDSGAVYVFERDDVGGWTQDALIKASNAGLDDYFGSSVSISEGATKRFLAVGAPYESSNGIGVNGGAQADDSTPYSGAVYVYEDSGSGWPSSENYYIKKAENTSISDLFGSTVALSNSGVTLAIGAPNEDSAEGAVYVFRRNEFGYTQSASLKAQNAESFDQFGYSLSLSGDGSKLAVGAVIEDDLSTGINGASTNNDGTSVGAAYVFARSNSGWLPKSYVKASNARSDDTFGNSLSLSEDGRVLAIGAGRESGDATGIDGTKTNTTVYSSGAVYLY